MSTGMTTGQALRIAIAVEVRKFAAARVPVATTLFLLLGVTAIATGMALAARSGDPTVVAKLGPAAALQGWDQFASIALQVTAAASVVAFGLVLSWAMGREFADGTVTGLYGLPVPRAVLAAGKLIVYLVWTVGVAAALVVLLTVVGWLLGLAPPTSGGLVDLFARLGILVVLSGLIATPAAWAATLSRGLMAGIGATVALVASAQILAISDVGAWYPFTTPALWALAVVTVSPVQLALVAVVPALFCALTLRAWATLQLDR